MDRSTRLSIVEHALTDVVERLHELPRNPDADALRALAVQYTRQVESWQSTPPDEHARAALLERVLDLNVAVIRAGGEGVPSRLERRDTGEDTDAQFPKVV